MKTKITKEERRVIDKIIDKVISSEVLLKGDKVYQFGYNEEKGTFSIGIRNLFSSEAAYQDVFICRRCDDWRDVSVHYYSIYLCKENVHSSSVDSSSVDSNTVNLCVSDGTYRGKIYDDVMQRLLDYIEENKYEILATANTKASNFPCKADELF